LFSVNKSTTIAMFVAVGDPFSGPIVRLFM